jgi:hypothetical protein
MLARPLIDPQAINAIFKQRVAMARLESGELSAHGLATLRKPQIAASPPQGNGTISTSLDPAGVQRNITTRRAIVLEQHGYFSCKFFLRIAGFDP